MSKIRLGLPSKGRLKDESIKLFSVLILEQKKMPKTAKSYYCEFCEFSTFKKSNYDQHLLTRKHQIRTNSIWPSR